MQMQLESCTRCYKLGIKWSWTWTFQPQMEEKRTQSKEKDSLMILHKKKEKKQTLSSLSASNLTPKNNVRNVISGGCCGVMKRYSPPTDRNRMEINTVFVMRQNRFWHLAECHAGQLLQMASALINIAVQQRGEKRREGRTSKWSSLSVGWKNNEQ